jgi:mannitol 2-dehydrogenase
MAHPLIAGLFRKIEVEEIVPHVAAVPSMTPLAYVDLVERRFCNAEIFDTTRRVAFDGSSRHAGFLHLIIRDALDAGTPIEGLTLVEALWARMCVGRREDGSAISPNDPFWDDLGMAAKAAKIDPQAWLAQTQFYGDLGDNPRFAESFARWLSLIWEQGTKAALQTYLEK